MNILALIRPNLPEQEILDDFLDSLGDHAVKIEHTIAQLKQNPQDHHSISELFRQVHTIKGDASLSRLVGVVMLLHPLESLLVRLREKELLFSDDLAELFLLTLDRLELMGDAFSSKADLGNLKLPELVEGLENLQNIPSPDLDQACGSLIELVTGFRPTRRHLDIEAHFTAPDNQKLSGDLLVFRSWALQFEDRSPLFKGRVHRVLHLCQEMNSLSENRVDPTQIEAAVYMHDVGMMLLPEKFWLKPGNLSNEDRQMLLAHPDLGADLLSRIPGWEEAARIVREHHEMQNGAGYPRGLTTQSICQGARILAVADAFESIMMKHNDRGRTRSALRAAAEINACDAQFDPEWITRLNTVVHRLLESPL